MNNPSAKITINNDHGLARTPLKGGRFRPEIALQRFGPSASPDDQRFEECNHTDKHDGNPEVQ